jgi:Tfp pilus assembly protein PilF
MKRLVVLLLLILAAPLLSACAQQGPDDQYVVIYTLMQQADALDSSGQPRQALAQYLQVRGELQKFQNVYPDWNPRIINFRLNYIAEKITEETAKIPAATPDSAPPPATPAPVAAAPSTVNAEVEAQLGALHTQVQQLQADNSTLQAKLKEALGVQPAAVDPRELARARKSIRSLMKENDLLKVSLAQGKTKAAPVGTGAESEALKRAQQLQADNTTLQAKLKEARGVQPAAGDRRELARARESIRSLMKENDLLKAGLAQGKTKAAPVGTGAESEALKRAQLALAEANQKLAEQTARISKLDQENQALQSRLQTLLAGPEATAALREENAVLKKQLAELKPAESVRLNDELDKARKQITVLESAAEVGFLEKAALENRVRQLQIAAVNSAPVAPTPDQAENAARLQTLTQERDNLLAKLGEANRELYGRRKQDAAARIGVLTDEVTALRARLAVDEAQVIPYTPEELALFKQPAPQLAGRAREKKSIKELPGGSAQLVAEAQNYFSARQFDKAEDDYQKILQRDENNGLVLANLATIEMEQGKLADAEKHITAAVAQSPNDAFNLSVLGQLRFRQEKYDDALDALSRAAKLDPRNPEIENYLGVTLGHKGLRAPAETALRKAIQLDPNYGPAHNNLAVIYINQTPALVELARWHYQKALDAGQPRNPDLEKVLDAKGAPASPQ